ncbi:hypothetical protein BC629DRAFT_1022353 [Irpex lacteus]|nr:hypothetical protein BC629DRAFT_1022353 [Irpex lacteus]
MLSTMFSESSCSSSQQCAASQDFPPCCIENDDIIRTRPYRLSISPIDLCEIYTIIHLDYQGWTTSSDKGGSKVCPKSSLYCDRSSRAPSVRKLLCQRCSDLERRAAGMFPLKCERAISTGIRYPGSMHWKTSANRFQDWLMCASAYYWSYNEQALDEEHVHRRSSISTEVQPCSL